jgi:hypothetical protein
MSVLLVLLGKAIRLGSIAAYVYLLWNGRWLVIVTAIGFSFLTPAITALVNLPMGVFWKELGYPEALTTPGLQLLVNPVRLLMVSRIPQLVYGGLAYAIGLAAFLLFSSSSHALERAALMITGYETGFAVPTVLAATLIAQGKSAGCLSQFPTLLGEDGVSHAFNCSLDHVAGILACRCAAGGGNAGARVRFRSCRVAEAADGYNFGA